MPTPAPAPMTGPELLAHRIKLGLIRIRYRRNQVDPAADTPARTRYRNAYEARKARWLAQGLTTKGKPRSKRGRPARTPEESASRMKANNLASYVRRRDAFLAAGLNSMGKPRRREWDKPLVKSPSTASTTST